MTLVGREAIVHVKPLIAKTGSAKTNVYFTQSGSNPYGKEKKRKLTISEAASHCSSAGGILLTLANKAEEDQLVEITKSECNCRMAQALYLLD